MNILESTRRARGLTFEALGNLAGYPKPTAFRHCHMDVIPGEAALRYHRAIGIPLSELRPDLYEEKGSQPAGDAA